MNPKQFLQISGIAFIILSVLGFIGPLGPTAQDSLFGQAWWFDNAENWAHLVLGIVAIAFAYKAPASILKPVTVLIGILGLFFGFYNLASTDFLGANLENPADTILHFVIGAWALYAGTRKEMASREGTPNM